eukprot:TRINITY_DN9605_c0_g1_i2.p1 TRINITY_DN9605_c0_g1~~TRINITY_DN9605_c0_g1_i2.p1  ORF type:complete len:187 (-),score=34.37 TRINITY_DN9605_c0_g1_i2:34-594(-)
MCIRDRYMGKVKLNTSLLLTLLHTQMGQHHSLENLDSREQFQVLPAPVRSPIFGEVNILKDVLSFEEFYVKMYDEDGTEEKARRDMIVALWHENLLRVHYVEEKGRHVRVVFDKVENSIVEEIMRRSAKGREPNHFTEPELWYLALSMIGPLSLLQKNGISHGQLSSRCISPVSYTHLTLPTIYSV